MVFFLIVRYLSKRCEKKSSLSKAILDDLQNPQISTHLQALGLWGKLLTGPWMTLVYAADEKRNHLDMVTWFANSDWKLFLMHYFFVCLQLR